MSGCAVKTLVSAPEEIPLSANAAPVVNEITLGMADLDESINDMSAFARQARLVPSITDDRIKGFKVYRIKPESLYTRAGIKNDDIIHSINDIQIDSPEKVLTLYGAILNGRNSGEQFTLSMLIERNGTMKTLIVHFK